MVVVAGVATRLGVTFVPMPLVVAVALLERVEVLEVLLRLLGEMFCRGSQGFGEGAEPDCCLLGGPEVFGDVLVRVSAVTAALRCVRYR